MIVVIVTSVNATVMIGSIVTASIVYLVCRPDGWGGGGGGGGGASGETPLT